MTDEQKKCVESYAALLAEFISGKIDAATFERSYLHKFKNESMQLPQHVFEELDRMFGDVDAYSSDPLIRSADGLDDEGLLASAKRTVAALKVL
ncbi:MAG: colicin immunity domain-containing protein [Opitutaceae bacterium]|nr:colicin immunity domain-containing protein [Opitutaceae bacterium]